MTSFRFIHCADLHIDSPLRGLEADPDAPAARIRNATRDAFSALVNHAIEQKVDFVIAAGDLYDGDWQDWRTGQFLVREVGRLSKADIPFIAIRGNHDAQSVISRHLDLPKPARLLSFDRPQTYPLAHLGVVVHGQSFATRVVTDDLSKAYPPPTPGLFNIGVLHTDVDGRHEKDHYSPSNLNDLRRHGYDYWALGHVHNREILNAAPWIIYPGNLQGRHVREAGPKGAYLVSVIDGRVSASPRFLPFDTVRWRILTVDLGGAADEDAARAMVRAALTDAVRAAEGRLLAVRLVLTGVTALCAALTRDPAATRAKLQSDAQVLAGEDIWVESVVLTVKPPMASDAPSDALTSEIRNLDFAAVGQDAAKYSKDLLDRLAGLRDALGDGHPAVMTERDGVLPAELLDRARTLLLARLTER